MIIYIYIYIYYVLEVYRIVRSLYRIFSKMGDTVLEKEALPNGDKSDLATKEKENSITCCSWKFVKLLYSALVTAVLYSSYGQALVFSSPLLDEMIRDANSTPWFEWTDNCLYQSLIGPSVLIGGAIGGISSSLLISILGSVLSMVLGAVMFAVGWSMIGVSWFLPSSTMFWGLMLTGRLITGLSSGWSNATRNVRF